MARNIFGGTEKKAQSNKWYGDVLFIDLHVQEETKTGRKYLALAGLTTERLMKTWMIEFLKCTKYPTNS